MLFRSCYSSAGAQAAENKAYSTAVDNITYHFSLGDEMEWTTINKKSTLKIKFKSEKAAKNCMAQLFRIDNHNEYDDDTGVFVEFEQPYNGWYGDSDIIDEYFNYEIPERLPDGIGKYADDVEYPKK